MIDDSVVGYVAPPFEMPVERGKIIEFAKALHLRDLAHSDVAVARAEGHTDVVAPLTFSATWLHWMTPDPNNPVQVDLRNIVAAGAEWEYMGDIVAGDTLTVEMSIAGIERKEGRRGPMTILTREFTFTNQHGQAVLTMRSNMIEFAPSEEQDERG